MTDGNDELISRDDRQTLSIKRWFKAGGKGILECCTGYGKTRVALRTIKTLKSKKEGLKVLVIVPHKQLQQQWTLLLANDNMLGYCDVKVVNSAAKKECTCDLLVCDEIHMFASPQNIKLFRNVKHKYMLGLTATLERMDDRHLLLTKYYPVVDKISVEEAIRNKWISDYHQIRVLIDVDLTEYDGYNKEFNHHFAFFSHNFSLAMDCVDSEQSRINLALSLNRSPVEVMVHAMGFIRSMSKRKKFIQDHPMKVEVANMIINNRLKEGSKIITFTKTIEHAEQVCCGPVYHSKMKKLEKDKILKEFNNATTGVLNTGKALDVGSDLKGITTAIVLSGDSSKTTKSQRSGRALRFAEGKTAEIFHLVLAGTQDERWFTASNDERKFITIRYTDLERYLQGEYVKPVEKEQEFTVLL